VTAGTRAANGGGTCVLAQHSVMAVGAMARWRTRRCCGGGSRPPAPAPPAAPSRPRARAWSSTRAAASRAGCIAAEEPAAAAAGPGTGRRQAPPPAAARARSRPRCLRCARTVSSASRTGAALPIQFRCCCWWLRGRLLLTAACSTALIKWRLSSINYHNYLYEIVMVYYVQLPRPSSSRAGIGASRGAGRRRVLRGGGGLARRYKEVRAQPAPVACDYRQRGFLASSWPASAASGCSR
jgi:hypothetical protein